MIVNLLFSSEKVLSRPDMVVSPVLFQYPFITEVSSEHAERHSNIITITSFFIAVFLLVIVFPDTAFAQADKDFVSKIIDAFNAKASQWYPIIKRFTESLFRWLLIFEVAYLGIRVSLGREQIPDIIKQFCIMLITAGFFLAVIRNYDTWSWNLINGLQELAGNLGAPNTKSQGPFQVGLEIVQSITEGVSIFKPGEALFLLIAGLVVIVCFAFISARMVLIKCEAIIAMAAALILVGLGASSLTKNYAINTIRYVFSVAFKLFVMQLVLSVGIDFINDFTKSKTIVDDVFTIIGASIVLLALVQTLPDVVAGIINGSHVGSGAGLGAAAGAVGGAAAGAVIGAGMAGSAMSSANQMANLEGKTGIGKLASMAGHMVSARQEAKTGGEKNLSTRTSEMMRNRLAVAQEANKPKAESSTSSTPGQALSASLAAPLASAAAPDAPASPSSDASPLAAPTPVPDNTTMD